MVPEQQQIQKLVDEMYEKYQVEVEPRYPQVLVRVLPKAGKVGTIFLPDGKDQNKPVYEGLVVKTYKPFWKRETQINKDGEEEIIRKEIKCEMEVGQHVLFQHYQGAPIPRMDPEMKGDWRLVQEAGLLATVAYTRVKPKDALEELLVTAGSDREKEQVEWFLQKWYLVEKDLESKTLSGV